MVGLFIMSQESGEMRNNNEKWAESENEKQNPNHEPNVSVKHQAERLFVRQKKYSK